MQNQDQTHMKEGVVEEGKAMSGMQLKDGAGEEGNALSGLQLNHCNQVHVEDDRDARIFELPNFCISDEATKKSPLFKLSYAVRKRIYRFALTSKTPMPIKKHTTTDNSNSSQIVIKRWRFLPALLKTCREIYDEATPEFFSNNTFYGTIRDGDLSEVESWFLETSEAYLGRVSQLTLIIEPTTFVDLMALTTSRCDTSQHGLDAQCTAVEKGARNNGIHLHFQLPELKHLAREGVELCFTRSEVEKERLKWVEMCVSRGEAETVRDKWVDKFWEVFEECEMIAEMDVMGMNTDSDEEDMTAGVILGEADGMGGLVYVE